MALAGYLFLSFLSLFFFYIIQSIYKFRKYAQKLKKHGIPYIGNGLSRSFRMVSGITNIREIEKEMYDLASATNVPLVGMTDLAGQPTIYVKDLDLIKNIYVKDFDHFFNRRPIGTESVNKYMKRMLFFLENDQWKGIRSKLSPTFTTGKIKKMLEMFKLSSVRMENYLKNQIGFPHKNSKSTDLDLFKTFPKYGLDVIASLAFGIDSKCFDVPPGQMSQFEKMANQFGFKFTAKQVAKIIMMNAAPKVADFFGLDVIDPESENYFATVVKDVIKRRRETGETRDDFLQLMLDAQKGLLTADDESNEIMNGVLAGGGGSDQRKESLLTGEEQKKVVFADDHIIANGLLFLMAGYDPSQALLFFTFYNLAVNNEIQEKCFKEVEGIMKKNGDKLTYEGIIEMRYLDMVINETLRMYLAVTRAERVCGKDYPVPGTNFVIEKGSNIVIPVLGIHEDAKHFPDPERFIPERFSPESKATRHPYAFMPFGHGPRNCIGTRFALFQSKVSIAQLVHKFQFSPCSKTVIPIEFDKGGMKPKDELWLNVTVRDN